MSPARRNAPAPAPAGTPDELIAAADAEIRDADAAVAALETAAAEPDSAVTPDQLAEARTRAEWARFRRAGAEKRAAALAEELAAQAYAELHGSLYGKATAAVNGRVDELLAQARPILAEALHVVAEKNAAVYALARHLHASPRAEAPASFYDGHRPTTSWIEGPDGTRHQFTDGVGVVRLFLDNIIREL